MLLNGTVAPGKPERRQPLLGATQPATKIVAKNELITQRLARWALRLTHDPKQVLKSPLASGSSGVDFYREFLDAPKDKYRAAYKGRETLAGTSVHKVELTPIQRAGFKTAVLWIDAQESLLRKVEITEENGSVRTVTLGAVDVSPRLAADAFRFTPPVGAQVITR